MQVDDYLDGRLSGHRRQRIVESENFPDEGCSDMSALDPHVTIGVSADLGLIHAAYASYVDNDAVAAGIHTIEIEDGDVWPNSLVFASISELKNDPETGFQPHAGRANFEILSVTAVGSGLVVKFRLDHPQKLPFRITYLALGGER